LTLLKFIGARSQSRTAPILGLALVISACAQIPAVDVPAAAPEPIKETARPAVEALSEPADSPGTSTPELAQGSVNREGEEQPQREKNPDSQVPQTLWERIRLGFAMEDLESPLVQKWEDWYSSRPEYLERIVERSRRILFHVVEQLEKRGMPTEIALLPIVESAYNTRAYSRAHAVGIWQFIPSTGKLYGLKQNWWYDGRRDIVAATSAALDYLQRLHEQFGDWELALASYNAGEGRISRAIERSQARGLPTDYLNLLLPNETRNYLPKLQAVKNIVSDPARFGLSLADIPNEPYFTVLTVPHHIDIRLAAELADISLEEFQLLNPAHNRRVINADSAETIVLPKDKAQAFLRNLASHPNATVSWRVHKVKRGDTLWKIGRKNGVPVTELRRINDLGKRTTLRIGQRLLIPKSDKSSRVERLRAGGPASRSVRKDRHVPKAQPAPSGYRNAVQERVPKHSQ
jgi:membrane-bound lytic murein transglycosylase D